MFTQSSAACRLSGHLLSLTTFVAIYQFEEFIELGYHHQCSAQGQVLHCKLRHQGCNSAQRQVFHCKLRNLGMNRCNCFLLLSVPHSLFSIWINLKRSKKIPGAPTRRWGEWIWLTGPSGLHRNSPQGLNISSIRVFDQIRDPEIPITLRPRAGVYRN